MGIEIFTFVSDGYHHALPPYVYLMEKYWPAQHPVTIVGFAKPTNIEFKGRYRFLSLGDQADYPWKKYSDALIKFLDQHAPPIFLLMLEDYLLVREVSDRHVQQCWDYMVQNPDVLRFDICADRVGSSRNAGYYGCLDIIQSDPNTMYFMSLWTSIFNRDQMKRVIIPGESPHDIEIFGTTRARNLDPAPRVLGTLNYPLHQIAALRGQNTEKWELGGLSDEDRDQLQERGWLE